MLAGSTTVCCLHGSRSTRSSFPPGDVTWSWFYIRDGKPCGFWCWWQPLARLQRLGTKTLRVTGQDAAQATSAIFFNSDCLSAGKHITDHHGIRWKSHDNLSRSSSFSVRLYTYISPVFYRNMSVEASLDYIVTLHWSVQLAYSMHRSWALTKPKQSTSAI